MSENPPEGQAPARRQWPVVVREILETIILALLIFLAVRSAVQPIRVEGISMDPSLQNGQWVIVNKLAYAHLDLEIFDFMPFFNPGPDSVKHIFGRPRRGDIVVFHSPVASTSDVIKRIIGEPGETVEIKDGRVFIDGVPIEEPYIRGEVSCHGQWCGPLVLQEGQYFVLGDNRNSSRDSRFWGPVSENMVVGKAWLSYWPTSRVGLVPNHSVGFAAPR